MNITIQRALLAIEAMVPLMQAAGLSADAQRGLCRLWKSLGDARDSFLLADAQLAAEYADTEERGRRRAALLADEVDIDPVRIPDEPPIWAASTPIVIFRLEGLLLIGEEGAA